MSDFDYSVDDLDVPLDQLFNGFTMFDFGITDEEWDMVEAVDFNYFEQWDMVLTDERVEQIGFDNINDFRNSYTIAQIYNNYNECGTTTIRDMLWFCYDKAKSAFKNEHVPLPLESGNILEYLQSFNIDHLMVVGLHR